MRIGHTHHALPRNGGGVGRSVRATECHTAWEGGENEQQAAGVGGCAFVRLGVGVFGRVLCVGMRELGMREEAQQSVRAISCGAAP